MLSSSVTRSLEISLISYNPVATLPQDFFPSLAGNSGAHPSSGKNKIGIGGDAISRCLEGLTCTLQSLLRRYSITFSNLNSSPPHTPSLFLCKFGQIMRPIFSKSGSTHPQAPVNPPVTHRPLLTLKSYTGV